MRCANLAKGFALDALALRRKGKARADYFGDFTGGRAGPDGASAPAGLLPLLDRLSTRVIGPYRVSVQRCTSL